MEPPRHNKTHKRTLNEPQNEIVEPDSSFKNLLEDSAREAYSRPWHRIERGLRLNRLRIFVEEIAPQFQMSSIEKENFFIFLQKALDKKLLNTLKVVNYDQEKQRIIAIRGLEIKRNPENVLKWGFSVKKQRADGTRKKKRDDIPQITTQLSETKIESTPAE
jgi:hypothetical protein